MTPLMAFGNFINQSHAEQERREARDPALRAAVREARGGLLPRQARGGARAQRRGPARGRDLRARDAARADAVDAAPGALELPRPAPGHLPRCRRATASTSRDARTGCPTSSTASTACASATRSSTTCRSSRPCGPMPARSASPVRRVRSADAMRGIAVQLFGLHAPNDVVAVAFAGLRLDARAGLAEVDAAHLQREEPVQDLPLADSAPTATPLLSALEEYVLRARRQAARRAARAVQGGLEPAAVRHRRAPRRSRAQEHPRQLSVIVFVSSDAPVDRAAPDAGARARRRSSACTPCSSRPTVESLPAVCRSYIDVTPGSRTRRSGSSATARTSEHVRVEGVSNALHGHASRKRLAPVVDASTGVHDSSDIPTSVMFLSAGRSRRSRRTRRSSIERWRQNNTIVDRRRAATAAAEEGGQAARDHRAGRQRRDDARPAHPGPARARRRHHRRRQVGVPAGVGARAWPRRTAPTA